LYVLVLSSTLLPGLNVLMVLLAVVAVITLRFWRSFIKVYSKAQVALRETLSQPPVPEPTQLPLAGLLRDANLERLEIAEHCFAAGKLIREVELRTRTGASIVGIERRSGVQIVNPGPDEELQPGDQVLLVGTRAHLDAAKSALSNTASPSGSPGKSM
jgi:CPA2 family monovalent cation:H+ antiporter-2